MKILFVSNINPHFHNTNYYRVKALAALGHEVVFFNIFPYLTSNRLRSFLPLLQQAEDARINRQLIRACRRGKFDLCLCVGGHTVFPETVRALGSSGTRTVLWTTDSPHPGSFRHIVDAAPVYDRVFCAGSEAMDILRGCCAPVWLPFCCDPECHAPQVPGAGDEALCRRDIAFVGSYYPNRGKVLEALSDHDIGVWGPLWGRLPGASPLKKKVQEVCLEFARWIRIYSAARIVLVVHYQDGKAPCYQVSPKLFEAMACGAFVLCDAQRDAQALFQDQEHLVFFSNGEDLRRKVDHYLARPEECRRIAANGRREVLEKHTYRHRMGAIMDSLTAEA